MRCRACNNEMEVAFWLPDGALEPVLEDLCPYCLYIVRAMQYDGGPDNELDILLELGVDHGYSHSKE